MTSTTDYQREKEVAAARSLDFLSDGMIVGLGSGSTSAAMVKLLGERVKQGLQITGVPTSVTTQHWAEAAGIPLATLDEQPVIDVTIDGADEVDHQLQLIKGGGGALLREKIVASASKKLVIIADSRKLVDTLGAFPLPIEVVPFAAAIVQAHLETLNMQPKLRVTSAGEEFRTDENNVIFDCHLGSIAAPVDLAARLNAVPGIVEHGLFIDMADAFVLARGDTAEVITRP